MSNTLKTAVFYHCWYDPIHEPPPYQNMRTPVLVSIATLRAHTDLPIYVLDLSSAQTDWSYFPEKFNFQVHQITGTYAKESKTIPGWRHLSRIPDVHALAIAENIDKVIYSDSDVFWLGPPNIFSDLFTFDGSNSGYYNYAPKKADTFIHYFQQNVLKAISSIESRNEFKKYCSYNGWYGVWDEMILGYMINHMPELFSVCPPEDHVTFLKLRTQPLSSYRMLHANGSSIRNAFARKGAVIRHSPGVYGLAINEIYNCLRRTLTQNDLQCIFSREELDYFVPRQFVLSKSLNRLDDRARIDLHSFTDLDGLLCSLPEDEVNQMGDVRNEILAITDSMDNFGELPLQTNVSPDQKASYEPQIARMKRIIKKFGWLEPRITGGACAVRWGWYLIVDSDKSFLEELLPLIQKCVDPQTTSHSNYPEIIDAIRLILGVPQYYGTQFYLNEVGHSIYYPIESPELLCDRRRSVGLLDLISPTISTEPIVQV